MQKTEKKPRRRRRFQLRSSNEQAVFCFCTCYNPAIKTPSVPWIAFLFIIKSAANTLKKNQPNFQGSRLPFKRAPLSILQCPSDGQQRLNSWLGGTNLGLFPPHFLKARYVVRPSQLIRWLLGPSAEYVG